MSRHSIRRSPREWVLRGGLAALALALCYLSVTQTLGFALAKKNAERAYALAPGDGRVAGELAERIAANEVSSAQRARSSRLAHQALLDEPLAVSALTTLALNAQIGGRTTDARRLFLHSDVLSRRELATRLWLIEDSVERGDIPSALRHYDIALRTAKGASELLFPVLSQAVADPAITAALVDTLATRPPWSLGFVSYLANSGLQPKPSADLFRRLAQRGVTVPGMAQATIVNALVERGAFDDAWSYYRSFRPNADRRRSRDPDFAAGLDAPSMLDWVPVMDDAGITASIQATRNGGLFDFAAPSTVGGTVLRQFMLLPPGRYRVLGRSKGVQQRGETQPYWQLACSTGRELGRIPVTNSADNKGRFGGNVVVPKACPAQILRLVLRPSPNIGGVTGQIEQVSLVPYGMEQ